MNIDLFLELINFVLGIVRQALGLKNPDAE